MPPLSSTERSQKRRARLDAEGRCIQCGGKRDTPSRKRCKGCRKRVAQLVARHRERKETAP